MRKGYNAVESLESLDTSRDRNISLYVRGAFESMRNSGLIYGGISMMKNEMLELEAAIAEGFEITQEEREVAIKVLLMTADSFGTPYLPTKKGMDAVISMIENNKEANNVVSY
jgi:hypothetical protein